MMDVFFLQTRPEQPGSGGRAIPEPWDVQGGTEHRQAPDTDQHPRVCSGRCLAWSLGAQFGAGLYWEVLNTPSAALGVPGLYSACSKPGLSPTFPQDRGGTRRG